MQVQPPWPPPFCNVSDRFIFLGKGIASLQELGELTISIPWGAEKLKKGQIINCSNVHESPILRFKERMQAGEIKSTLNFPLFIKGEFYGFMGFDECRYYRNWIDEDVYILTTAGQIITKAIENKMYEEELEKHRSRLESVFSSVQDAVVTVDTQMNVISANKAVEHICRIKAVIGRPFIDCASQCNQSCVEVFCFKRYAQCHQRDEFSPPTPPDSSLKKFLTPVTNQV
ncbi:MAG: PAS domain-containing protein [Desulfobacterales bacterium]|nr:PAS domain-containing protein [Desulfobacterales bacterium]